MSATVARPIATLGQSTLDGERIVLTVRTIRLSPGAAYPVRLATCPSTMLTPTAFMKPTSTAFDTNRRSEPSFSSPASSITMPVRTATVATA